jgi:PAS domain S-box-containing protein
LIVLTSTSGFIVLLLASLAVYFTERQRMGEALRQSEERLREAVRASQTGIFDHDHVTGTIYWSPEHRRIYGWDADEPVTTQKFMEHVLAEDREKVLESIRRTFDPVGDGQNDMEFRIIDRNGKTRWLSTRSHTYYEGEGGERRLLRTVDAVADITEHKQTEDALRDLNENLERLVAERTEELAKARDTAEHANLAKSDFLSRMSHELRTPLHSILGFSQMLEDHVSQTEEEKQIAQQIWNSGRHLLMLIDEVLDIARIEAGKLELFLEDVDLSDILAECLHLVQGLADKKYVVIHQKEDEGLAVHTDRLRLKQILLNLLSNAIKYNQQGGSITVNGVAQPNGYVRVTVTDTGKGIPEDQQGLVFQPFTRIHPKDRATAGTGIGLTISQKLVEEMGGKMGFESRPGVGSTFWFELPASDYHRIKDAALPTAATAQVIATPATTEATGKVLYIEDTPTNVQLMRLIIKRLPGVELLDTDTAEQGIVLAKEVHPALILMDINLPGMDGIEALQVLRRDETTRDIPVIAVSAAAMPHDLERIQQAGFDNHLGKPFNIQEVPALLTKHLTASKDI